MSDRTVTRGPSNSIPVKSSVPCLVGRHLTMDCWGIVCWGLFGGFAVEGLEFWSMVRKNKGVLPVQYSLPYLCGQAARILIGAGLAVAFWESGAVTSVIGAVGIGAAAPAIVKKLME